MGMSKKALHRLRNPPRDQSSVAINEVTCLVIDLYMGTTSEDTYKRVCKAFLKFLTVLNFLPDLDIPSYYKIKRLVASLTGIEPLVHDMCVNSCLAYTGPFLDLDACPLCSEP